MFSKCGVVLIYNVKGRARIKTASMPLKFSPEAGRSADMTPAVRGKVTPATSQNLYLIYLTGKVFLKCGVVLFYNAKGRARTKTVPTPVGTVLD